MKIDEIKGLSLVEMMIVMLIVAIVIGGGFLVLSTGQSTWFTTDVNIRLQENLRKSLERMTMELRQTQIGQQQIFNGTGPDNTDIIRFSVPIVCEAGENLIDVNGDVAHWGAPLTWGCTDSTCMDADNDCDTLDYASIEYRLNNNNQLVRRVLDGASSVVRSDIFAHNISDFQAQLNGNVIAINVSAQESTVTNRIITGTTGTSVYLRN